MRSETKEQPRQQPILELWRIVALALIVAAGMLFVHLVVPSEADASANRVASVSALDGASLR
ncbi:MAG: hypothetical protein INR70_07085 [Parafilimonas terrae]|jgi:hypothetical protein|nr:hypothetical protein [Parafilimonas terrae]